MILAIQINSIVLQYDSTIFQCSIDQFNSSYSINITKISDGTLILNSVNNVFNWSVNVSTLPTTQQNGLTYITIQ